MVAVDTNVIVRLIARDDARQVASGESFIEPGIWVSTLALAKAMWVLASVYDHTSSEIAGAIEMLMNNPRVTLQDADAIAAALEVFRTRPSLGFTDCVVLELARKAGHLPLGTFDRGLARIDGTERL